jgi:flagellar protein FlgJ
VGTDATMIQAMAKTQSAMQSVTSAAGKAAAAQKSTGTRAEADLKKACQDFESIFISMIFRQMMDSIPKGSDSSVAGAGVMNSLGDQAISQQLARQGGFGLADALYKDLARMLPKADAIAEYAARMKATAAPAPK